MTVCRYSVHLHDRVQEFLLRYEKFCVNLVEEFILQKPHFFILFNEKEIAGVININDGGQIKHCLPFKTKEDFLTAGRLLTSFFAGHQNFHVFSIAGEKNGTELLRRALNTAYSIKESSINEYFLMEHDGLKIPDSEKTKKSAFPQESILIRKCSLEDAKKLFLLQKNYLLEEVYTDHSRFKSSVCLFNLEQILKTTHQIALFIEEKPVAKGGSNAAGINYIQLGGIFTAKEFRGQGLGRKIVTKLVKDFAEQSKKSVLFVKIANEAAVRLYQGCGFVEKGRFAIVYYQ